LRNFISGSKTLYETETEFNGRIFVKEDNLGVLRVICGGPTQSISPDSKKVNELFWGKIIEYMLQNSIEPKKVLILGFCAGTFAHMLNNRFEGIDITGVEIDSKMLDIAKDFFKIDKIKNLKLVVADAFDFVKKDKEQYDFILIDTYLGSNFPQYLASTEFIEHVKKRVTDDGVVIMNMLNTDKNKDTTNNLQSYMKRIFDIVERVNVKGMTISDNVLLIGKSK